MKSISLLLIFTTFLCSFSFAQNGSYLHFVPENDCSDGKLMILLQRQLDGEGGLESAIEKAKKKLEKCGGTGEATENETEEMSNAKTVVKDVASAPPSKLESTTKAYSEPRRTASSQEEAEKDFSKDYHGIKARYDEENQLVWFLGTDCQARDCKNWQDIGLSIPASEIEYEKEGENKWIQYRTINLSEESKSIFDLNVTESKYQYIEGIVRNSKNISPNELIIVIAVKGGIRVLYKDKDLDFPGLEALYEEDDFGDFSNNLSVLLAYVTKKNLNCEFKYFDAKNKKAILWVDENGKSSPILLDVGTVRQRFGGLSQDLRAAFKSISPYTLKSFESLRKISN